MIEGYLFYLLYSSEACNSDEVTSKMLPLPSNYASHSKKLRLCCNACAVAKVKCSKERSCRRCVRRGHSCFYAVNKRPGRPTQKPAGRHYCEDLLELPIGINQPAIPLHAVTVTPFPGANAGTAGQNTIKTSTIPLSTSVQPTDNVNLLPHDIIDISDPSSDLLSGFEGEGDVLVCSTYWDPSLAAQSVLCDTSSTGERSVFYHDEGTSRQWYLDTALFTSSSIIESPVAPDTQASVASTDVFTRSNISNNEPFQFEPPSQGNMVNETFGSATEGTTGCPAWMCDCSMDLSSLLDQLALHSVIGAMQAGDPCNLDVIISRNEESSQKVDMI